MRRFNGQIGGTSQATTSKVEKWVLLVQVVLLAPRALLGRRVTKVQQDYKALVDQGVKKVPQDHKVRREHKDHGVLKATRATRAIKVKKVILGLKVVLAVLMILTCKTSTIFCD